MFKTKDGSLTRVAVVCGGLVLATAVPAAASPGDLDPTFGAGGRASIDIQGNDVAGAGAIQPDGRIVMVGGSNTSTDMNVAVARLTAAGAPDPTFGGGSGSVASNVTFGDSDAGTTVAVLPSGKLLVGGHLASDTNPGGGLLRYEPSGTLDSAWATDGVAKTAFLGGQFGGGGLALPDGGALWFGTGRSGPTADLNVVRYDAEGAIDTTFGTDGLRSHSLRPGSDAEIYRAGLLQPDGKILVGGDLERGATGLDWGIARLNPDGSFDTSFSGDGRLATSFDGHDYLFDLALQADGKIVAVGSRRSSDDVAVARYLPDGTLDPTFDGDGRRVLDLGGDEGARAVAIQDDGKIVVAGDATGEVTDMFITRFLPDGSPDASFGTQGTKRVDFDGGADGAHELLIQADGKIVALGWAVVDGSADFGAVRLQGDAPPAGEEPGPSPGGPGPQGPQAPHGPETAGDTSVAVRLGGRRLPMRRGRVVRVRVTCPRAEQSPPCRGTVRLRTRRKVRFRGARRRVVLARTQLSLAAGETRRLRLRIGKRKAALLRRSRPARRVVAIARVGDTAGNRTVVRKRLRAIPRRR